MTQRNTIAPQLAIDARWLVGGIGTYTRCLLDGLAKHDDAPAVRVITRPEHKTVYADQFGDVKATIAPIYGLAEHFALTAAAGDCGLLHVPHFNIPLLFHGRMIVTIHDLILTTVPPYDRSLRSRIYAGPMLRLAAKRAAHIITVSACSKEAIIENLDVSAEKVSVIPNAVRECFRPMQVEEARRLILESLGISWPFLLFVGNFKPHKNVLAFLRAVARLRSQGFLSDHAVLLIGDDARERANVSKEIAALGLLNVVKQVPHLSEHLLASVYSCAEMVVVPSSSEGFGLPVVEAMACGTPVVCTRIPAFQEIAGDAAFYARTASPEDIAQAVSTVASAGNLRDSLRAQGLIRAGHFDQHSFIKKHIEIYQRFLPATEKRTDPLFATRERYESAEPR